MTISGSYRFNPMSGVSSSYGLGRPNQGSGGVEGSGGKDAAIAKLKLTDPTLADKLQGFETQIADLKASGASKETIGQAMKANFDSLTATQQSEVKAVMGGRHKHHGGPKPAEGGSSSASGAAASTLMPPVQNNNVAQMLLQAKSAAGDADHDGDSA